MIKFRNLKAKPLDRTHFYRVAKKLREYDRRELEVQNLPLEWENFKDKGGFVVFDKRPIAMFGVSVGLGAMYFWFLATEEWEENPRHWITCHMFAQEFIDQMQVKHFGKRALIQVWEKHEQSVKWINRLGFKYTGHYTNRGDERLLYMER